MMMMIERFLKFLKIIILHIAVHVELEGGERLVGEGQIRDSRHTIKSHF